MTPIEPSRARLTLLIAGLSSFVLLGAGQAVMGPALPVFQVGFALNTATAGWLISSLGIGSFIGLVGMYFVGRHVAPRLALAVMATGAAGVALSPGFLWAVLGGTVFGIGYGAVAALFNARVLTAFGAKGPGMVSLLNAFYSVGAIAAPLSFVALGSDPWLVFAVIAGLTALIMIIAGPARATASQPRTGGRAFRFDWPILTFGALAIGVEVCLTGLGPSAMIRAGIARDLAAQLLSGFFVAFLAGRLALTLVADRVPPFAVYTAACLFTALCALGCAVVGPLWFFVPMGFSTGLFFPGYFVTATVRMGDDPRVAPVILAMTQVGAVFAPLALSSVLPSLGDRGFFWVIGAGTAAMTLVALVSYRGMSRQA